jgi:1-acyl-sn-glycerol-3-phosphate acyltransferase
MLALRSLAFNLAFYVNLVVWMLLCMPAFLLPRRQFLSVPRGWARSSLWLLKVLAGTRFEVRGRENIPPGGFIVAAKHQSFWETFALYTLFDDPAFIHKRELTWIPFFGWYLWKAGMVPVNRRAGSLALVDMNRRARKEVARGRQILVFPEGTRRAPGAPAAYKFGIAHIYANLEVPCLPVGLNSGLFWPRRRFLRRPGTIIVEFMEPIQPGLSREVFLRELQTRIEESSNRLLAEGRAELDRMSRPSQAAVL